MKSNKPEGMNEWDWTSMSEHNFAELCVFHVPDKPLEHQVSDYFRVYCFFLLQRVSFLSSNSIVLSFWR